MIVWLVTPNYLAIEGSVQPFMISSDDELSKFPFTMTPGNPRYINRESVNSSSAKANRNFFGVVFLSLGLLEVNCGHSMAFSRQEGNNSWPRPQLLFLLQQCYTVYYNATTITKVKRGTRKSPFREVWTCYRAALRRLRESVVGRSSRSSREATRPPHAMVAITPKLLLLLLLLSLLLLLLTDLSYSTSIGVERKAMQKKFEILGFWLELHV